MTKITREGNVKNEHFLEDLQLAGNIDEWRDAVNMALYHLLGWKETHDTRIEETTYRGPMTGATRTGETQITTVDAPMTGEDTTIETKLKTPVPVTDTPANATVDRDPTTGATKTSDTKPAIEEVKANDKDDKAKEK